MDEKTGKKVAELAAKILAFNPLNSDYGLFANKASELPFLRVSGRELKALAASCLTQAPDKKKPVPIVHRRDFVSRKAAKAGKK